MQDRDSGNWWLLIFDVHVGYWPKVIFTHLQQGATYLQYGGWVFSSPDGNSPPMGNGHLPTNDYKRSCFFVKVKFVDPEYQEINILDNRAHVYFDTKCYYIIYWRQQQPIYGKNFDFGGPGGQCGI